MENEPRPVTLNEYPTIVVEGKPHHLILKWRDAQRLQELHGIDVFVGIQFGQGYERMAVMSKILSVALARSVTYTPEQLQDILDIRDIQDITEAVTQMLLKVRPQDAAAQVQTKAPTVQ